MNKKKRKAGYYLLFRKEEGQRVWLYERLQRHELNSRLRNGWKISG
ncbi:hypothetical protein [Pseudobacillus badius]|nr:hypothetical protein [Bacillus badius]TDW00837.1 hypothetical protein B0G66_11537 [Bacillus badius]